jgi:ABC-type nickel/cobalt efflux system permease component RcnA
MLLLTMIFVAGVLHGLGPDHLAAITAFGAITGQSFQRIAFFSVRFALGHAVVICVAALLAHFVRVTLPLTWERGFDLGAAALLLITGFALAFGLISGRLTVHAHPHHHHDGGEHRHVHAHFGEQAQHQHGHGRLAFLVGGLFAMGGARSLLLIVPVALAQTFAVSMMRIAAFTIGIVVAMSAYGLLAGSLLIRTNKRDGNVRKQRLVFRLTTAGAALFCVIAGLLTLSERLHS